MLRHRPRHADAIASGWHLGFAVVLSFLAGAAWVGMLYHERARQWIPVVKQVEPLNMRAIALRLQQDRR